jgi:hypothetical protein
VGHLRQAPFAGPQAVLAYLARYTHRVAISNSRLIALDHAGVTFKWKDYRIKGRDRLRTMTLDAAEFIRRFLLHVLPSGFHRIRHYGLFAGTVRARNIERVRQPLAAPERSPAETDCDFEDRDTDSSGRRCPCCGGRMIIVETFEGVRPALVIADPDQDRHLMTIAALPAAQRRSSSSPTTRRSTNPMSSRPPQTLSSRRAHTRRSHPRPRKSASCSLLTITPAAFHLRRHMAIPPRPQNPHSSRPAKPPLFLSAVWLSDAGPAPSRCSPAKGRRPKPFSEADIVDRGRVRRSGRKGAYAGRLRKDRSASQSRRSNASITALLRT